MPKSKMGTKRRANGAAAKPEPSTGRDWDDLRFFLALAHKGTLAGASRSLGVEVSTVHRRLGQLEAKWGFALFERTPSGHVLTDPGRVALEGAQRVEDAIMQLNASISSLDRHPTVTVAATDDIIKFLAARVRDVAIPKAQVRVRLIGSESLANLARREADIAIRFSGSKQEEVVEKPLCSVAFALYASRGYVEEHGRLRRRQLTDHGVILPDGSLAEVPAARWLAARVAPSQVQALGGTVLTMAALAAGGLGIAPLPCFVGDLDRELVRMAPPIAGCEVPVLLAYHTSLRNSGPVKGLVRHLKGLFAEHQDLFAGERVEPGDA